ncbi:MAPEG family protein [Diaphorobacter ruginosibacter]|uniref:MAPEG family protein n=1 Tax=Diaphorobacter ruginosibacter TaxID=1715720 RepID=A0A7G9RKJ1_9BURK|nr:MAPEG family protein [Diaphorobacter ruginosibacter]QNN56116.1 MAPEG family protein [Diaphorobacter ruginosibacter]
MTAPSTTSILWPAFALAGWTLCMILLLAFRRVRAVQLRVARLGQFALGEAGELPTHVALVNRNYMNLLEMPVLFYTVCVLSFAAGITGWPLVGLAWAYVALRMLHSLVHVTYNRILHRFALFAASNVVLALMWVLAGLGLAARG